MQLMDTTIKPQPFFPFPKATYHIPFKDLYTGLNGGDSASHEKEACSGPWISHTNFCPGPVLQKATWTFLHIVHGVVNGKPGSISRFESVAYPSNPKIPGLFVMADMNETEDMGRYLVFYTDLIIQDGQTHDTEKQKFAAPIETVCRSHGQDFKEHNSFITGRGVFGGCAGECGLMGFFQEKDIPFLENLLQVIPSSYQQLFTGTSDIPANEADYETMHASRARFVEWMITENIGVKVLRENNIPLSIVEASSFPPVVRY
jgi:hypothetical protein